MYYANWHSRCRRTITANTFADQQTKKHRRQRHLSLKVICTKLKDVKLVETDVSGDNRGFSTETYTREKFVEAGIKNDSNQDNVCLSAEAGVLRGSYYVMAPQLQTKLGCVVTGVVEDVLVDIAKGRCTYGVWEGYILSVYNVRQLLVSKGSLHGSITLTPNVNFVYKVEGYQLPEADRGIAFDDPDIGIDWPMCTAHLIMSEKDVHVPQLKELENNFIYGEI